jgi:hypothetical protein
MAKFLGAKVATAIIFLAVAAGGLWCYRNPETVKSMAQVVKLTVVWTAIAGALPWSSYLFMRPLLAKQASMQSAGNAAATSIAVIALFTLADILLALWMASWSVTGGFTWLVLILGFAAAAAYNFVICESLARQVDS